MEDIQILPFSTAYAESPEPEENTNQSLNNDGGDINNRSRSPSLFQQATGYRVRSPRIPMAIRLAIDNRPAPGTYANSISLPVLSRPQDMNGVDITNFADTSPIRILAQEDAAKLVESLTNSEDSRSSDGLPARESLLDLPTTAHKYSESQA